MEELVSIIMPSYNTAKFIEESIESVRNQTYTNWELIIVDDCSTDNTEEIVRKYEDSRIKFIKNNKNSGAAISRNRALREANGRWIAFLDSDDLWMPDKLKQQLCFMKKNGYAFSYTEYEEIDEKSNSIGIRVTGPKKISKIGMYSYCWPGCLTVMYDRNNVGDIQIADLKKNNDYAMWLKVIHRAECYCLKKKLAQYRKRQGSISNDKIFKLVKSHYELFRAGENRSKIISFFITLVNLVFGVYKKVMYVKKIKMNEGK